MRILHTMLRVSDLEKTIAFYTTALGMRVLRRKDYPERKFTLAFVGYEDESEAAALELNYNWDTSKYELGTAFGHIAIGVTDTHQTCEEVKKQGGKVVWETKPTKPGSTVIGLIEDPDGYQIELIQRGKTT